jgi:heme O synthase-like polyprenyltransferase
MIKKYITPINIVFFLWGLILLIISEVYRDKYTKYYLYFSIIIIIPFMIVNLIKQRKEDKIKGTTMFKSSIYRMLIMAVLLVVVFFITKQNQI